MERRLRVRRVWLILLPFLVSFTLLVGVYFYIKPKVQAWISNQVQKYSQNELPVNIRIGKLDWELLYIPKVIVEEVEITPKDSASGIPKLKLRNAVARLDVLYLFAGQVALSSLEVTGLESQINLDPFLKEKSEPKKLPMDQFFKVLEQIPLKRLELVDTSIELDSPKELELKLALKDADLQIAKYNNKLTLDLKLTNNFIWLKNQAEIPFALESEASLTKQVLEIEYAKIQSLTSLLSFEGAVTDIQNILLKPQMEFALNLFADLDRVEKALSHYKNLPDLRGTIQAKGRMELKANTPLSAGLQLATNQIAIDQFEIGSISSTFELQNNILRTNEISITNEAGLIDLQDIELKLGEKFFPMELKAKLQTEMLDLNQLLINLGVGDIPLELFVEGQLGCRGVIDIKPDITCEGELHADELEVRSGDNYKDTIVRVSQFKVDGNVNITQDAVSYKTNLHLGENKGTSQGRIGFADGFHLFFESPHLNFNKIDHLAGLKFEGTSSLSGFTKGDSNAAIFQMNLNSKDVTFEDFVLGSVRTDLRYKSGHLFLENMEGQVNETKYFAELEVDLQKSRIKADAQSPAFQIGDLLQILQRKIEPPVLMSGTGSVQVTLEGPFNLGGMSYTLLGQIKKGSVAGENFDQLNVQLFSQDGQVQIRDGLISKASSIAEFSGTANPDGILDVTAKTKAFPLELSNAISGFSPNLYGELDLNLHLTGQILNPTVHLKGEVNNVTVDDKTIPNSQFDVSLSRQTAKGSVSLMNNQLKTNFAWPFDNKSAFNLRLDANQWNFTSLFVLTGAASIISNYDSSLTGTIELAAPSGGFLHSSGSGKIQNIFMQRDDLRIENPAPMELGAKDGVFSLNKFLLTGPETRIEVLGQRISSDNLGVDLSVSTDLRLFQIFLPFLDELGGKAEADMKISGALGRPEVLGNAQISNGFVKIKDFPHAIERLEVQAQFSQHRINITKIKGNIGGGTANGEGLVRIEGVRNIPTEIRARVTGGTFNVPDRIRTSGDLDLSFTGSWFPFILSGTYQVRQGFVDKEFGGAGGPLSLKQSAFLPKVILQSSFEPILLDLDVILERGVQVKNSLLEGAMSGRINIKGPPSNPVLFGKVSAEKNSKLFFNEKPFDVITMNVDFKDANEINPELFISAQSRIESFDINLVVQGTAKNPNPDLTSLPPLPKNDIISLLALGVTQSVQDKRNENLNQQNNQGSTLGQSAVENAFGAAIGNVGLVKDIQKRTGVALQFSSAYDDTKNVNVQKITASKKLTDRFKASASQLQGGKSAVEVKLEYQLNQNVSAVGSFERREPVETTTLQDDQKKLESIFGLDLEFRQEFK
jgi:translocation and assembly module TamB